MLKEALRNIATLAVVASLFLAVTTAGFFLLFVSIFAMNVLLCALFSVLGLYLFFKGLKGLKFKRMIENIPTSKISSIALGLVEVYGEVQPKKLAKISFYEQDGTQGKDGSEKRKKRGIRIWEEFYLKDDTGSVIVRSEGAHASFPLQPGLGAGKNPPPDHVIDYFNEQKMGYDELGVTKEYALKPGDKVYVMGTAASNPSSNPKLKGADRIVIRMGENDTIFYISSKSEKDMLRSANWKVFSSVVGGAALAAMGLIASLIIVLSILPLFVSG